MVETSEAKPTLDELFNRHHELIARVKELEARIQAIRTGGTSVDPSLDELKAFTHTLVVDLNTHIHAEEDEYGRRRSELAPSSKALLDRVVFQHRALEDTLETFLKTLSEAHAQAPDVDYNLLEMLLARARRLRYSLRQHTADERLLFRELQSK